MEDRESLHLIGQCYTVALGHYCHYYNALSGPGMTGNSSLRFARGVHIRAGAAQGAKQFWKLVGNPDILGNPVNLIGKVCCAST